jgi:nucleoid DNA-binding protein
MLYDSVKGHELKLKKQQEIVDAFLSNIEKLALQDGKIIRFTNFGSFSRKEISATTKKNPKTGELVQTKESTKLQFHASDKLPEKAPATSTTESVESA